MCCGPRKRRISRHCGAQFSQRNAGGAGEGDQHHHRWRWRSRKGGCSWFTMRESRQFFGTRKAYADFSSRSVFCAPLIVSNEAFAVIYLENRELSNHFNERHESCCRRYAHWPHPDCTLRLPSRAPARKLAILNSRRAKVTASLQPTQGMSIVLETLAKIAPTELTVLIQGETGTGKELMARAIYRRSSRASGPFVVLNCAAIPATLIESELFGCVRGAYSGADRDRVGLIGSANRGTLFLDEIGEMPLESAVSLVARSAVRRFQPSRVCSFRTSRRARDRSY